MILAYIDETGDTGTHLLDPQQPIFVLGSLLVPEEKWQALEFAFEERVREFFNNEVPNDFELHTMNLVNRRKHFEGKTIEECKEFRDEILELVTLFNLKVVYRKIDKRKFNKFCQDKFGSGIKIEPYIMAFPFICLAIDEEIEEEKLGMLIFDSHHKGREIEKALRVLRLDLKSNLQTKRLIEKGFFVDSSKSYPIQIVDLLLYYIRKYEEMKIGKKVSEIHQETFPMIEKISQSLDQHHKSLDILEWVSQNLDK